MLKPKDELFELVPEGVLPSSARRLTSAGMSSPETLRTDPWMTARYVAWAGVKKPGAIVERTRAAASRAARRGEKRLKAGLLGVAAGSGGAVCDRLAPKGPPRGVRRSGELFDGRDADSRPGCERLHNRHRART